MGMLSAAFAGTIPDGALIIEPRRWPVPGGIRLAGNLATCPRAAAPTILVLDACHDAIKPAHGTADVGRLPGILSVNFPAGAPVLDPLVLLAIGLVSMVAGAVNSIAGGGTLLTFPALVGLGVPPIVANATSTVALWPGAFGSMWGYRGELRGAQRWAIGFAVPSIAGGAVGAMLLLRTPAAWFEIAVPWLIFLATALFMAQGPLVRRSRRRAALVAAAETAREGTVPGADGDRDFTGTTPAADAEAATRRADAALTQSVPRPAVLAYQFLVGIYGGYFGAGVGILMLAALGLMGLTNIHRMNGLKNWGGLCMNATAALLFAMSNLVSWPVAGAMTVGAVVGGYGGARMAQRVPQVAVRRAIIAIGAASGVWMLLR